MFYLSYIKSNIKNIFYILIFLIGCLYIYKYKHNIYQISTLQDLLKDSKTNNKILNDSIKTNSNLNELNDNLDNNLSRDIENLNSKVENSKINITKQTTSENNIDIIFSVYEEVQ